jgi:hypothetical protein
VHFRVSALKYLLGIALGAALGLLGLGGDLFTFLELGGPLLELL